MDSDREAFPDDIVALKAALVIEAARALHAEAELAVARAKASDDQALIANQQLQIEKLRRQIYGPRSERTSRLLDQIELQFEELESSATEDEIAAEMVVAKTTTVAAFTRKRPARKPFPAHLPRERVIVPPDYKFRIYTSKQKRRVTPQIKREMRRRAAVEPVIGHLKNEHRMDRNYLHHRSGDANNATLAAIGYNFSLLLRWLRLLLRLILAALPEHPPPATKSAAA